MQADTKFIQLCQQREQYRAEELLLAEKRHAVEDEIADMVGHVESGVVTKALPGVICKITYAVEMSIGVRDGSQLKLQALLAHPKCPADTKDAFRTKLEVDSKAYARLAETDKYSYELVSQYVTSKPKSPAFKIEFVAAPAPDANAVADADGVL